MILEKAALKLHDGKGALFIKINNNSKLLLTTSLGRRQTAAGFPRNGSSVKASTV